MSTNFNNNTITKQDAIAEYERHLRESNQGYFKAMERYNRVLSPHIGENAFGFEAWKKIVQRDDLFNIAKTEMKKIFANDPKKQQSFERLFDNTREVSYQADILGNSTSIEGWGGGNAVYASSQGAFAMGATPFIIGGWLAAARSEEIFQHIDNQNTMRLEFEYNIDYMQVGDQKFYFPQAFRSGDIVGYNKLPKVDWVTPNTQPDGGFKQPTGLTWCGDDNFIMLAAGTDGVASKAQGNLIEACGQNIHKTGIEPNWRLSAVLYQNGGKQVKQKIHLNYFVTDRPNERLIKANFTLKNVQGFADPIPVQVFMKVNLDNGDFVLMTSAGNTAAENAVLKGLQFDGKFSNIANEMTNIPTMGTDKYQFIRECEYRNYSKVSLNEYMSDNFRIGSNNNITYAAYATDKNLQYTLYNRELEAEDFLIKDVLDDSIDPESFELTHKLGSFIVNDLSFNVSRFAPGLNIQDYKDGLKIYLNKVLATAETNLNIPASVKREWIFLGYDALITEVPEIKFQTNATALDPDGEGAAKNENYGFATDTKCGYIDNLGRQVRLLSNNDVRWQRRGNSIFGTLRTYSMEYPFLVYYPHAIRMFTAIDADNPNRTAIYIGGREFRGAFAAAAVQLELNGVLDTTGIPVNNFNAQVTDAKSGYTTV